MSTSSQVDPNTPTLQSSVFQRTPSEESQPAAVLQGHQYQRLDVPQPPQSQPREANGKGFSKAGVAALVTAVFLAVLGTAFLLNYLGKMQVSWEGLGSLSGPNAFYGMVAAYGAALLTVAITSVWTAVHNKRPESQPQL